MLKARLLINLLTVATLVQPSALAQSRWRSLFDEGKRAYAKHEFARSNELLVTAYKDATMSSANFEQQCEILTALVSCLYAQRKFVEAELYFKKSLLLLEKIKGKRSDDYRVAVTNYAQLLQALHRDTEAANIIASLNRAAQIVEDAEHDIRNIDAEQRRRERLLDEKERLLKQQEELLQQRSAEVEGREQVANTAIEGAAKLSKVLATASQVQLHKAMVVSITYATAEEIAASKRISTSWNRNIGTTIQSGTLPGRVKQAAREFSTKYRIDNQLLLNRFENGETLLELDDGSLYATDRTLDPQNWYSSANVAWCNLNGSIRVVPQSSLNRNPDAFKDANDSVEIELVGRQ